MKPSAPHSSLLFVLFLAVESTLYLTFMLLDLFDLWDGTLWLKYAGILLCLLYSLLCAQPLMSAALLFTAGADWFLLILKDHLLIGVMLFCVVQFLYALRLHHLGSPAAPFLRMGAAAALVLTVVLLDLVTVLNVCTMIYFSQLISNAILAWRLPHLKLFALGLSLFACCDICVGLQFALTLPPTLYSLISIGMWFFYLPSQVLITLSGKELSHETK